MIRFSCPCGRQLQAPEANAGQKAKCPICGAITVIPAEDEPRPSQRAVDSPPEREDRGSYSVRDEEPAGRYDRPSRREDRDDRRPRRDDYDDRDDRRARRDDYDDEDTPYRKPRNRFSRSGSGGTANEAQTALILSIVGVLCCNLLSPVAIVLGIVALNKINASGGELDGKGQAIAAIVIGSFGTLVAAAYVGISMLN